MVQVAEIDGVARTRDAWRVFCDAEDVEAFLLGCRHHLLQGAVGVAAHHGVGVDVKFQFTIHNS